MPVTIKELNIIEINKNIIKFYVLCTKGTYIRSLIDDIGKKLSYGAVMTNLTRVQSGSFRLENAHKLSELPEDLEKLLLPLEAAFSGYPKLKVSPDTERLIKNGIVISLKRANITLNQNDGDLICIYNEKNEFFAIMTLNSGHLKLYKTFFTQ